MLKHSEKYHKHLFRVSFDFVFPRIQNLLLAFSARCASKNRAVCSLVNPLLSQMAFESSIHSSIQGSASRFKGFPFNLCMFRDQVTTSCLSCPGPLHGSLSSSSSLCSSFFSSPSTAFTIFSSFVTFLFFLRKH